jgi:multiple sugar transport system permease protein
MSSTTVGEFRPAAAASQSMRRIARRQRYLSKALAGVLSVVVLIWTILPLYNIVMVSLENNSDVFSDRLFPSVPSLDGYWVVFTQGYWYLEDFWHQFGNSIYVGAATTFLTLAIASAASFSISRMRIRHGWMLSNVALMTYVIPQSFLRSRSIGSCRATA